MKSLLCLLLLISARAFSQDAGTRLYSLEECISIALENNLNVKISKLNLESYKIDLLQSKMDRLPNLNFNGGYGVNWGRSIDPTTNDFINQQIKFSSFSGQSSVTLFSGLQLSYSIKRDQLNLEASQSDLEKTGNEVAVSVTTFYLDVIFNKELLHNAKVQMEATQNQLDRTIILVDAGSLPVSNRLQLEAQLASDEVQVINNENSLNLSLLNLKQTLQLSSQEDLEVVVPNLEINAGQEILRSSSDIYSEALALQPEIRGADLQVESSLINLRVAKGSLYPSLSLNGSLNTNFSDAANRQRTLLDGTISREMEIGFLANDPTQRVNALLDLPNIVGVDSDFTFREQFDENLSKSLSLNLQIPVFNGWRTRNNMQKAVIANKQAEITAKQVRNQLRQNIETAHNNAAAALKSFQASDRQVQALTRTLEDVENRYNLGVANFVDFQIARSNLVRATSDLTRAKYDYIFRLEILDFYQGKPLSLEQ